MKRSLFFSSCSSAWSECYRSSAPCLSFISAYVASHRLYSSSSSVNISDEEKGVFRNRCLKPFPLRAALDVGGGGMISLCIGRVDVKAAAIQKIIYQTQLPLHLEPIPISSSPSSSPKRGEGREDASSSLFALSEASITDILNKMEILTGAMDHHHRQSGGVDERSAVLTWPVCLSENAMAIATHLERRFRLRARVLGKDFQMDLPFRRRSSSLVSSYSSSPSFSVPFPSSSSSLSDSSSLLTSHHQPCIHPWDTKCSSPRKNLRTLLSQTNAWKESDSFSSSTSATATSGESVEGHRPPWTHHRNDTGSYASAHYDTPSSHRSPPSSFPNYSPSSSLVLSPPRPPSLMDMEMLAFLSHAAAAQCVAPHRLLVVDEDPHRGIRLIGMNTSAVEDCEDCAGKEEESGTGERHRRRGTREGSTASATATMSHGTHRGYGRDSTGWQKNVLERRALLQQAGLLSNRLPTEDSETEYSEVNENPRETSSPLSSSYSSPLLVEHRVSLSVPDVHRFCITTVQHRSPHQYHLHRSSPNPMLRTEFIALRQHLEASLAPLLPPWVRRKSLLGGMIGGTSFNGGMLNIAARVAQKSPIPLEHLEMHAEYHFCGLTDVLLAENFPHPGTVLPSVALASALCRILQTPRLFYVPEVTTAVCLLLQPLLWTTSSPSLFPRMRKDGSASFYANDHYQSRSTEEDVRVGRGEKNEAGEMFYASPHYRWFHRPPIKGNPTAAPTAIWDKKK